MLRYFLITLLVLGVNGVNAADVTVDNFVRAETDTYLRGNMAAVNAQVGELKHLRQPMTAQNQTVIRQNQDTLYSGVVVDLVKPVSITLPDTGGRYQSMHVINQDHYMFVESKPGTYTLTEDVVGTRFAIVNFRTFVDSTSAQDVEKARAAQDGIDVRGGGAGPFDAPDWDQADLAKARQALSNLAELGFDARYAFGLADEVRPVDFLIGAAAGWGGLPASAAMYFIESVDGNDGTKPYAVTVNDVPVDAFWSITVYTDEGYLGENELGVNSFNSETAEPNKDGSVTIHFGQCKDDRVNCIPITPGWSYTVRLYQPQAEILDGSWPFPQPLPLP